MGGLLMLIHQLELKKKKKKERYFDTLRYMWYPYNNEFLISIIIVVCLETNSHTYCIELPYS